MIYIHIVVCVERDQTSWKIKNKNGPHEIHKINILINNIRQFLFSCVFAGCLACITACVCFNMTLQIFIDPLLHFFFLCEVPSAIVFGCPKFKLNRVEFWLLISVPYLYGGVAQRYVGSPWANQVGTKWRIDPMRSEYDPQGSLCAD